MTDDQNPLTLNAFDIWDICRIRFIILSMMSNCEMFMSTTLIIQVHFSFESIIKVLTLISFFDYIPDAFNTELLFSCMERLKQRQAVSIPNYDFKTHKSTEGARQVPDFSIFSVDIFEASVFICIQPIVSVEIGS